MTKPIAVKSGFVGLGLTPEEQRLGKVRYYEYKKNYPQLNKHSNSQLLEELVWAELVQERHKTNIGLVTTPTTGADGKIKIESIPKHLQEAISNGLTQIIDLKMKLGLFEDQKATEAFKDFEALKQKALEYRKTHPLSFKCTCPYCSKIFFLKRRTQGYEEFKSPFYEDDKVVKNTPLYRLYKVGKITKEEAAEVMGVSPDYMLWLEENIYKPQKNKES